MRSGAAALVLIVSGCARGILQVETLSLRESNPTSFVFDVPVEEIPRNATEAFSRDHQYADPIFPDAERTASGIGFTNIFKAETRESALFSGDLLKQAGNEHDVYLHNFGDAIWPSPVYRGNGEGLPYFAEFHLHVTAAGEGRSRVEVTALDPQIVNGERWGIGPCGPGYGWHSQKVEATTVEEYVILRYLGRALGRADMPEVVLPAKTR